MVLKSTDINKPQQQQDNKEPETDPTDPSDQNYEDAERKRDLDIENM